MTYIPVIIPTLNRYEHFKKCIESLNQSPIAKYTELFIGFDYPPSEQYEEGHAKIKKYLDEGILGFAKVNIFERKENYGTKKNIGDLRGKAFEKYDALIYTEDDNLFSPDFLQFMNDAIEKYKHNESIIAICGYSYPVEWASGENNVVYSDSFFSAWGWATWKNKYQRMCDEICDINFRNFLSERDVIKKMKKESTKNYCYYISSIINGNVSLTDISISVYMCLSNKVSVLPIRSMVRNEGWDGSGINCKDIENDLYSEQIIFSGEYKGIVDKNANEYKNENRQKLNSLYQPSILWKFRSDILYTIIRILSTHRFISLLEFLIRKKE